MAEAPRMKTFTDEMCFGPGHRRPRAIGRSEAGRLRAALMVLVFALAALSFPFAARAQGKHVGGSCKAGESKSSGRCTRLSSDARNCGACGHACPSNQTCSAGNCDTMNQQSGETNAGYGGAGEQCVIPTRDGGAAGSSHSTLNTPGSGDR